MTSPTISFSVDAATARDYARASPEEQAKIQLLLRLRLRELTPLPDISLSGLLDEIGAEAEAKGLTPEILADLLRDE